jgi:hypothetical protein
MLVFMIVAAFVPTALIVAPSVMMTAATGGNRWRCKEAKSEQDCGDKCDGPELEHGDLDLRMAAMRVSCLRIVELPCIL